MDLEIYGSLFDHMRTLNRRIMQGLSMNPRRYVAVQSAFLEDYPAILSYHLWSQITPAAPRVRNHSALF